MKKYINNLVSIILPIYKVEEFLDKCMLNIIYQTYDNLEIIMVDDGSPDNCPKLCDDWQKKDSRIKVIHKANGGLSDARNRGLKEATGEYIYFIDPDDYMSLNLVERMVQAMKDNDADMVICQYANYYPFGARWMWKGTIGDCIMDSETAIKESLIGTNITNHVWRRLYKHELFRDDFFPVNMTFEDIYINVESLVKCKKIAYITDVLYYYYINPNGIVRNKTFENVNNKLKARDYSYAQALEAYPSLKKYVNFSKRFEKKVASREFHEIKCRKYHFLHMLLLKYRGFVKKLNQLKKEIVKSCNMIKILCKSSKPRLIVVGAPATGKLENNAVYMGELKFFNERFPDYTVISFPKTYMYKIIVLIVRMFLNKRDLIAIQGGDAQESLSYGYQRKHAKVINLLKKYKILVFPQTFFEKSIAVNDSGNDLKVLKNNINLYKTCNNLIFALRDEKSYEIINKELPKVKSILMPDMILNMTKPSTKYTRKNIICSLSNDFENKEEMKIYETTLKQLKNKYHTFIDLSMHDIYDIDNNKGEGKKHIDRLLYKLCNAKVVITNCLELVLLCAVTETPCVVIKNNNQRWETYEWIKELNYIKCPKIDELDKTIEQVLKCRKNIEAINYDKYYDEFELLIRDLINS